MALELEAKLQARDRYVVSQAARRRDETVVRQQQSIAFMQTIRTTNGITFDIATTVNEAMADMGWTREQSIAIAEALDLAAERSEGGTDTRKTQSCDTFL